MALIPVRPLADDLYVPGRAAQRGGSCLARQCLPGQCTPCD